MASPHETYIEKHLIAEIVTQLENEEFSSYTVEHSTGLDGFMSNLYNIKLRTKTAQGYKDHVLIAKFMRGEVAFRESSKSYIQFANEIYIYSTVLPAYEKLLKDLKISSLKMTDFVPPCYRAKFGYIEGLSSSVTDKEAALVLENLKPSGYQLGPRSVLNLDHLMAMCKLLGQYHAFPYALRSINNSQLQQLKSGIVTLPFIDDNDPQDAKTNLYRVLYRVAFDRFYDFYDRKFDTNTFGKKSEKDLRLIECLLKLREKYFDEPTRLLEKFRTTVEDREEDERFSTILHGDYNRNNVLFKYKTATELGGTGDLVEDIKMIDFQELRYGSPCLDLSFFMYINTSEDVRSHNWMELLQTYHSSMLSTLSMILKASELTAHQIDEILLSYGFEKFYKHFSRFAFYGVMICLHFQPWMLCSEEECGRLSKLFETDLYGEEFRTLSIEAGGDEVNVRILNVLRHACEMGYMDDL